MEKEMKETELEGEKSNSEVLANPLAYTSTALKELGYSSLAEAWIETNPFHKWVPYTSSWASSEESDYYSDEGYHHPSGSEYNSRLEKFIKDMEKYGLSKDDSRRFYEEVIMDFEYEKHRLHKDDEARAKITSYKNEGRSKKWSEFLGRSKKDWGNSPFEQFLWDFLLKNTRLLAV